MNILNKGLFLTNCWFSNLNIEGGLFEEEIFINGGAPVAFLCSGYVFSPLMVHCTQLNCKGLIKGATPKNVEGAILEESLTYRVFNLQCSGYLFFPINGFFNVPLHLMVA